MNTLKKLLVLSWTFGTLPMVLAEQAAPATEAAAPVEAAPVTEPVAPVEASAPATEEKAEATETSENQPSEAELNKFLEDLQKQMEQEPTHEQAQ